MGQDPIVAIDSNTLMWGIRRQGPPEQLDRARWLFESFDREKTRVILSAVALSEYLTVYDPAQHASIVTALNERFVIMPFDVRCASLAATLFMDGKPLRDLSIPGARAALRADTLIIATASINGATTFNIL